MTVGYRVSCDFGIDVSIHSSGLCPVPTSPSAEMTPGVLPGLTMPSGKGSLLPHSGHRGGKLLQNHIPATELPIGRSLSFLCTYKTPPTPLPDASDLQGIT